MAFDAAPARRGRRGVGLYRHVKWQTGDIIIELNTAPELRNATAMPDKTVPRTIRTRPVRTMRATAAMEADQP